jgi:hypothetical protein
MQTMTMSIPKEITMRSTQPATCMVVTPKLARGNELWDKIWITKFKNQQIFDSIARFDPASMTENPYQKVTMLLKNACQMSSESAFLILFVFWHEAMLDRHCL